MRRKKLFELIMTTASEDNYLELNSIIDKDPFDNLVDKISKKIKKKS